MSAPQLRLVADEAPADDRAPEQRVFDHWVALMGKNPRRTVLSPDRRKLIRKALELYDEDTLQLAIEGCACSAFHQGDNDSGALYNDIELILRNARNVERFADKAEAERVRERAQALIERRRQAEPERPAEPALTAEQQRERAAALRAMAAHIAGRTPKGAHG